MAASRRYRVHVMRKNEKGAELHQVAWAEFGSEPGQFSLTYPLLQKRWNTLIDLARVAVFDVVMERPQPLWGAGGGGLVGYVSVWIVSQFIETPVIRLARESADITQQEIRLAGYSAWGGYQRKLTRVIALALAEQLQTYGYRGMMPDLSDDDRWKQPVAATFAIIGLVVLFTCLLIGACVAVTYISNWLG
jgi:hypothetical protein